MDYLLDTNACIALMNGTPTAARIRFDGAVNADSRIHISSVVAFALWDRQEFAHKQHRRLETLLSSLLVALPFDHEDSRAAGSIRASLEAAGRAIGGYDHLIAGQALARGMILVTANDSAFSRVKGLSWQDWAKA